MPVLLVMPQTRIEDTSLVTMPKKMKGGDEEESSQEESESPTLAKTTCSDVASDTTTASSTSRNLDVDHHHHAADARGALGRELRVRRMSLTPTEHTFLTSLVANGDVDAIAMARSKLADTSLFLEEGEEPPRQKLPPSSFGRNFSDSAAAQAAAAAAPPPTRHSIGSTRRQSALLARRTSAVHANLWTTHETGLAVTARASRRSVVIRRESGRIAPPVLGSSRRMSSLRISALGLDDKDAGGKESGCSNHESFNLSKLLEDDEEASSFDASSFATGLSMKEAAALVAAADLCDSDEDGEDIFGDDGLGQQQPREQGKNRRSSLRAQSSSIRRRSRVSFNLAGSDGEGSLSSMEGAAALVATEEEEEEEDEKQGAEEANKSRPEPDEEVGSTNSSFSSLSMKRDSCLFYNGEGIEFSVEASIEEEGPSMTTDRDNMNVGGAATPFHDQGALASVDDSEEVSASMAVVVPPSPTLSQSSSYQRALCMRRASRADYRGEGIELSVEDLVTDGGGGAGDDDDDNKDSYGTPPASAYFQDSNAVLLPDLPEEEGGASILLPKEISGSLCRRPSADISVASDDLFLMGGASMPNLPSFINVKDLTGEALRECELRGSTELAAMDLATNDLFTDRRASWSNLPQDLISSANNGEDLGFKIFGTSADDESSRPHVLTPPMMESLQSFLPFVVSQDNFWMKYSMVRDGASLPILLQNVRGAKHTILAIETVDGEVFGSFTSVPWKRTRGYYGNGESFLWKMRRGRSTSATCRSVIDLAQTESDLEVFPWCGENDVVQMCTHGHIAVGGGGAASATSSSFRTCASVQEADTEKEEVESGFGIAIDSEMLYGTSSPCVTFHSPALSTLHKDGSPFEILNVEVWTLTPCISVEEAEKIEMGRLFLEENMK